MTATVYVFDECSQCWIDNENNAWSYTAEPGTWHPRIGDPRMARKKKEQTEEIEVLEALADDVYPDNVVRPKHYTGNKYEVWDVLDEFFPTKPLLWALGKYLLRAGKKGDYLEDLLKAKAFLEREIDQEKARRM